jgi:protein tyrosine/serine phosphatase
MKRTIILMICLVFAGLAIAAENPADADRPSSWATPLKLDGVPNLHRVSNDLFRSAQPDKDGMRNLKRLGIETVTNLRSFHSDRDEIGQTGLGYERIYMKAWHPEHKEVVRFLQIATNPKRTPVLVHCLHGADRTGTICALYRIAVQGWTKKQAIEEMTEGGFGFQSVFGNLPKWILELDVELIKKEAGLNTPSSEQSDEVKVIVAAL